MALGLALGSHELGEHSLWLDEAHSFSATHHNWLRPWTDVPSDSLFMSLYFITLKVWLVLGTSEEVLRGLSVLFWVASIPIAYVLGRMVARPRAATFAAFIVASHPFLLEYSQEARSYTMLAAFSALSTLAFIRAVRRNESRWWVTYLVAGCLALYVHLFAAFTLAFHVAVLALYPAWKARLPKAMTVWVLIGLFTAPLALLLATRSTGSLGWIREPTVRELLGAIRELGGGTSWLAIAVLALSLSVLFWSVRRWRQDPQVSWSLVALLAAAYGPLISSFLLSAAKPMFIDRYLIASVLPLAVVTAVALARLPPRVIGTLAVSVIVLAQLQGVPAYFASPAQEDWRGATQQLVRSARTTDGVIFHARYVRQPVEYYVGTMGAQNAAPQPAYPSPAWGEYRFGTREGVPLEEALADAAQGFDRIWLVFAHSRPGAGSQRDAIVEWAEQHYRSTDVLTFDGGIVLMRFERP